MLPFLYINNYKTNDLRLTKELEMRYNAAIDTAVIDAAKALKFNVNQDKEAQYESAKKINVNVEEAIQAFWNTLYLNFEARDDSILGGVLQRYVPAVVVIGYDGYYLYTIDKFRNDNGENEERHVLQPKKPYAYVDANGNSLSFTLDDFVTVYEKSTKTWHYGKRDELAPECPTVPLLQNAETFDQVRRITIVNAIQNDLQYFINYHNEHAKRYGISYTFTLPYITQEEWNNSIDDVGVMAFIQGLPIGKTTYNHYALGGSRLIKRSEIKGAVDKNTGVKYYFRNECRSIFTSTDYEILETYTNEKEAAAAGYFPLSCENPSLITHRHNP
jgi:hypothetical protein